MEVLRQPMEDGQVTISRIAGTLTYPCAMMVVAAMNPCPCGYFGHPVRECSCSAERSDAIWPGYPARFWTGWICMWRWRRWNTRIWSPPGPEESSAAIRSRVNQARKIQQERYQSIGISCNAKLPAPAVNRFCPLDDGASALLSRAFETMGLSARAYDRILKVSRTIADLDKAEVISRRHIAEAVQYRSLDRKYWSR